MTTRVKLDLKGFGEYLEKIAAAGANVDAAVGRALESGGNVLFDGMLRRVPKDTWNLHEHIHISEVKRDGNYSYILVGVPTNVSQWGFAVDADTARYGNTQEYGSSSMPAQPYIRPTMEQDAARARAAMRESLKSEGVV